MKHLNEYIVESSVFDDDQDIEYRYHPKSKDDLLHLLRKLTNEDGWERDCNDIDVSNITDLSYLFYKLPHFNGDISGWDVRNVTNMEGMFFHSNFNKDIEFWNTGKVLNMKYMFAYSRFDDDISGWDVSKVRDMTQMFERSQFNKDISKWDISKVRHMDGMFKMSKFNQDLSNWDCSNVTCLNMFKGVNINSKFQPKF